METKVLKITGNTYPVKTQLAALGATWDASRKHWTAPEELESEIAAIRVPVGGREQLWESCSRCGEEPVDASGLCEACRGTERLIIEPLLSLEDEARKIIDKQLDQLILGFYSWASSPANKITKLTVPVELGSASPFGGGYHIKLLADNGKLYVYYVHHYDGDEDRCYHLPLDKMREKYRLAATLLLDGVK